MLSKKPDFTKARPIKKETDPARFPNISEKYEGEFKTEYAKMLGTMTAIILKEIQ